jgi:hypothetical protein
VAHNVKPLLSRLGGLISNGYNWKPSFALLVAKKKSWCIESTISGRGSRFTLAGYVFVMLAEADSAVKGGNSL